MNAARSTGYATVKNAKAKLARHIGDLDKTETRYVIAVSNDGRYVPCVIGPEHVNLAHMGITVLG